jgi:hypothetical protein
LFAVDSTPGIHKKYRNAPQRDELELPWLQGVVPGSRVKAPGADWAAAAPHSYLDEQHLFLADLRKLHRCVNKGLELLHPIQNSLQLHPDLSRLNFLAKGINTGFRSGCAMSFFKKREKPAGPVGNVGKSRVFLGETFPSGWWESLLFADSHRRGHFPSGHEIMGL